MADSPNPSSGDLPAGAGGSPEKPVLVDRRVAALAGAGARYKAMSPARLPISREPCLTIPAGFSPGALLESPVLLNNFKVEPSPTTGTLRMAAIINKSTHLDILPSPRDNSAGSGQEDGGSRDFEFKPHINSQSAAPAVNNQNHDTPMQNRSLNHASPSSNLVTENKPLCSRESSHTANVSSAPNQPVSVVCPSDNMPGEVGTSEMHQINGSENAAQETQTENVAEKSAEDGYNWRKYGQKHVKGSENPRSYYKCTHPNCEVKKLLERSLDGQITEVVYKGRHNHPKPQPNRRIATGAVPSSQGEERYDGVAPIEDKPSNIYSNLCNQVHSAGMIDTVPGPASDDDVDAGGGRPYPGDDTNDDDDLDSKRRKMESAGIDAALMSKPNREPRVVVQTASEVDILDDGYRWRKYGQKVVKGNPNPRSYYKCTHTGCPVRKHVERASHDPKSVITTYEGKHNHEVPASRNATHEMLPGKYSIVCFEALINGAWGAKRARSALGACRSISNKRCVLEVYSRRQPYRGPKRARFELRGSCGETGLSRQSLPPLPPDNRCVRLIHFRRLASWGAKRSRSALGGGRKASPSVRSLPGPNNSSITCTRDWANLGDGPAGLIAELALASDVADYVRFRAVCKPWRQCSPDPCASGLDVRFLPRQWIMLDKAFAGSCRHRFLNVSTGECIRMGLPELLEGEHRFLEVTPEGLLLLFHKPTMIARLLNPLTRQLIDLPPLTAFVQDGDDSDDPEEQGPFVKAVGLTEESIVAVSFSYPMRLAFAKPGDDSWTVVNNECINSALLFAGRFYCATYRGVMVLNITSSDQQQQPPRLTMVADLSKSFRFSPMMHSLHLVDNGGELMLVHRAGQHKLRKYDVYRLDLEAGILIPVKRLNGRAMFIGKLLTISVSVEAFPYITADTINLGYECDINTEGYNIADGSRYSRIYDGSVSPGTIVKSLINCIEVPDTGNQIV